MERIGLAFRFRRPARHASFVTATKFDDRPVVMTRRVEATITTMPVTGPQEIRVDVAFMP